jgi:hypothetical protein
MPWTLRCWPPERIIALNAEIDRADRWRHPIVIRSEPASSTMFGVGPEFAGQMLSIVGENPTRRLIRCANRCITYLERSAHALRGT